MQNRNAESGGTPRDVKTGGLRILVANLTELERKVLARIVQGESIESLSSELSITPDTALQARDTLMVKLSARTTADLVREGLLARVRWP